MGPHGAPWGPMGPHGGPRGPTWTHAGPRGPTGGTLGGPRGEALGGPRWPLGGSTRAPRRLHRGPTAAPRRPHGGLTGAHGSKQLMFCVRAKHGEGDRRQGAIPGPAHFSGAGAAFRQSCSHSCATALQYRQIVIIWSYSHLLQAFLWGTMGP